MSESDRKYLWDFNSDKKIQKGVSSFKTLKKVILSSKINTKNHEYEQKLPGWRQKLKAVNYDAWLCDCRRPRKVQSMWRCAVVRSGIHSGLFDRARVFTGLDLYKKWLYLFCVYCVSLCKLAWGWTKVGHFVENDEKSTKGRVQK